MDRPVPPATTSFDDATDVTHSTAFNVLNALVDEGQISEARAEYLQQKFTELHTRVLAIYKRDNALLRRARELRTRLETERQRVLACGEAAQKDDEVIQALKRNLLEQEKELTAALERESVLQVEVLEYDRRKQYLILSREDAVAAEEGRLRPKMEALQADITTRGGHIKELAAEQEKAEVEADQLADEEAKHKGEIGSFASTLAQAGQQLQNVKNDPQRAQRQLELVVSGLISAQRELANTEEKIAAQTEKMSALDKQRSSRGTDVEVANKHVQTLRADLDQKRRTLATLNTSLEVEMEARQAAQDRVVELEQLLLTAKISLQQEEDGVVRIEREKERCMRTFYALEQAKDDARHAQESAQEELRLLAKEAAHVEACTASLRKQTADYQKDVAARTRKLLIDQAKSKAFVAQADAVLQEVVELEETIAAKGRQEEAKRKELAAVAAKRQELSRASAREASRVALAQQELQMREVYLKEVLRRTTEMTSRLNNLAEHFQKVKRERAQKVTQIHAMTQTMTQMAEKTKLLQKELSVLGSESTITDQEIAKAQFQANEIMHACENLRVEKNRHRVELEKAVDREREVRAQVRRLNGDIASAEDTMVDLRRAYAAAIETRDHSGIELIDRNDEAALLVARVKAQETALADGGKMTNDCADEVRRLKASLANIMHDIEACQRAMPRVTQLELELGRLREELEAEQWRSEVLEEDLTDPKNSNRWRRIPLAIPGGATKVPVIIAPSTGKSKLASPTPSPVTAIEADANRSFGAADGPQSAASPAAGAASPNSFGSGPSKEYVQLQARCQDLESRVQALGAKLREKDLILAEVTELAGRVETQADSGKDVTLALAQQVNRYHSSVRNKSRQMMATISELSLFQASSIQLQQEVQRLESVVEEAEERMESGEAPYAEAEEQYERTRQRETRYAAARHRQHIAAMDADAAATAMIATTAPPRPNAYVPANDTLGLARPYGPFAPFKPSTLRAVPSSARMEVHPSVAGSRQPTVGFLNSARALAMDRPVGTAASTASMNSSMNATGPRRAMVSARDTAPASAPPTPGLPGSHGVGCSTNSLNFPTPATGLASLRSSVPDYRRNSYKPSNVGAARGESEGEKQQHDLDMDDREGDDVDGDGLLAADGARGMNSSAHSAATPTLVE